MTAPPEDCLRGYGALAGSRRRATKAIVNGTKRKRHHVAYLHNANCGDDDHRTVKVSFVMRTGDARFSIDEKCKVSEQMGLTSTISLAKLV